VLIEVSVPDVKLLEVPGNPLIKGWDGFPYLNTTMDYGTQFLINNEYLLLKVPSAVIKTEYNYLLNPKHPSIHECKIEQVTPFVFDTRISK